MLHRARAAAVAAFDIACRRAFILAISLLMALLTLVGFHQATSTFETGSLGKWTVFGTSALAERIVETRSGWVSSINARSDSLAWSLADYLFSQPVVSAAHVCAALDVSDRGARNAITKLVEAGVLRKAVLGRQRNVVWQADAVLEAMDDFARSAVRRR